MNLDRFRGSPIIQIFAGGGTDAAGWDGARTAHVSSDPTVISHCPFCGGGAITGRSDGGADCSLCGRNFTVMEQPIFSNMPSGEPGSSVPVTPFDPLMQESPFDDGAAGADPLPGQEPAVPGSPPAAGSGPAAADPATAEDPEDSKPAFLSALRSANGTPLHTDDFVTHHAIRLARAQAAS